MTDITTQTQQSTVAPFGSNDNFEKAWRMSAALSSSSLVPSAYQGEKGRTNVLVAMELASRMNASPLLVMQNLHIVSGRPAFSASFLIATVNSCGRFSPLDFECVGDDPDAQTYKVRAFATDLASGEKRHGAWITWKMVNGEGWASKSGSKWKTMPQQMFMYRAAAFWTRVYAPEQSLGMMTSEEAVDISGGEQRLPHAPTDTTTLKALGDALAAEAAAPAISHEVAEEVPETKKPDINDIFPLSDEP